MRKLRYCFCLDYNNLLPSQDILGPSISPDHSFSSYVDKSPKKAPLLPIKVAFFSDVVIIVLKMLLQNMFTCLSNCLNHTLKLAQSYSKVYSVYRLFVRHELHIKCVARESSLSYTFYWGNQI